VWINVTTTVTRHFSMTINKIPNFPRPPPFPPPPFHRLFGPAETLLTHEMSSLQQLSKSSHHNICFWYKNCTNSTELLLWVSVLTLFDGCQKAMWSPAIYRGFLTDLWGPPSKPGTPRKWPLKHSLVHEWVRRFLMAHHYKLGYSVPFTVKTRVHERTV